MLFRSVSQSRYSQDQALKASIREHHRKSRSTYGTLRIQKKLAEDGAVRSGSILLSIGAAAFTLARYAQFKIKRNIELILPLMICIMLFGLAISLPNAR